MQEQEPSYNWPVLYTVVLAILLVEIGVFWWLSNLWQ